MDAPETSELQAFIEISSAGSVSGAADELGLPRATLSRRLARLEERLGVRLIERTTRQMKLTDAGEEFHGHARTILAAVEAATAAVQQDDSTPRGLLRVSMPPMGNASLRALMVGFVERYPLVELQVSSSTRHEDLVAGNIDVALRAGEHIDEGLVARQLARAELLVVAAPAYLKRKGTPRSKDELASHTCLLGFAQGQRPATHWPLRGGGRVRVRGKLISNEPKLLTDAAVRGLGLALLPEPFVANALKEGALVKVLPEIGATSRIALVYTNKRLLKPSVRAFVDHIVEELNPGETFAP